MADTALTIRGLTAAYAPAGAACHELALNFGGRRILLRANSGELVEKLRGYFNAFHDGGSDPEITVTAIEAPPPATDMTFAIRPPEPGKSKIKEEFADLPDGRLVRKTLTGMVFAFGGGTNLAIGPCLANDNQVVNFIINRYIELMVQEGCLLLHAAAAEWMGAGIGMAGFSGMGKSTLALRLMNRDARFVSNDRLLIKLVEGRPVIFGVPKLPRINPGTALNNERLTQVVPPALREEFSRLSPGALWKTEYKFDVYLDRHFGPGRFILSAPLRRFVILNWRRSSSSRPKLHRVVLDQRRDLLAAFTKTLGLFHDPAKPAPASGDDEYVRRLADVEVLEITGGVDFDRAADMCLEGLAPPAP